MAESYNKLRSKLNRAIAAYLVSAGAGTDADVSPANSRTSKGYPNTTVRATLSKPEVMHTGVRRITVHISIKGSAVLADADNGDQEGPRMRFDTRVGKTADALLLFDGNSFQPTADAITTAGRALAESDPEHNADMVDFTLMNWYEGGEGDGEADAEGCDWEEILIFDAICCSAQV